MLSLQIQGQPERDFDRDGRLKGTEVAGNQIQLLVVLEVGNDFDVFLFSEEFTEIHASSDYMVRNVTEEEKTLCPDEADG